MMTNCTADAAPVIDSFVLDAFWAADPALADFWCDQFDLTFGEWEWAEAVETETEETETDPRIGRVGTGEQIGLHGRHRNPKAGKWTWRKRVTAKARRRAERAFLSWGVEPPARDRFVGRR